ncbi:MAG: RNA polymerase sigma factor, partial [Solirubrobacteraceae bacterium]
MYATSPGTGTIRDALWSQLGDEKLARRAASGNDGAFTALYERYHGPLLNYCRSILLNAEDAHDATQNALESALRALPDRDDGRPLRPWLYRIAHNEAVTILRRRQPHAELADDTEPLVAPHPSPEVYAEQRGRIEQLVQDLRALPERQRGALVMRELSGLSYDEIGVALGLSPTNARRAVFDARSALLDVAGGRDADCVTIRHALSDGDRRSVRARRIRAHLRSCDGCSSFHAGIGARRADLPAISPWLTGAAAAGALGIAGGATGGGGAVVAGGGLGWVIFPGAAKGIAVAAVIATTGTAAIEIERAVKPDRPAARSQAATGSPRSPGVYTPASAAAHASRAAARRAARRAGAYSRARH